MVPEKTNNIEAKQRESPENMAKKIWLISFCITLVYFIGSNILLHSTLASDIDNVRFLYLPAIIMFGFAYTSGVGLVLILSLILFIVFWLIFFGLTYLFYAIYAAIRKK